MGMKIQYFSNYQGMSAKAAQLIIDAVKVKPELLFCAATGGSPTGMYQALKEAAQKDYSLFEKMKVIKLDEWGDVDSKHPVSCEYYLQEHLVNPLKITPDRYMGFSADAENPSEECARVNDILQENGPIDICILGIGTNGHIGFNEPNLQMTDHCHVAKLAPSTLLNGMVANMTKKPTYGLTLGVKDILSAKHIIILVAGSGKEEATKHLVAGEITNDWPATHLWSHPNVDCLIVEN